MIDPDIFKHNIDLLMEKIVHLTALWKPAFLPRCGLFDQDKFENPIIDVNLSWLKRIRLTRLEIQWTNLNLAGPVADGRVEPRRQAICFVALPRILTYIDFPALVTVNFLLPAHVSCFEQLRQAL